MIISQFLLYQVPHFVKFVGLCTMERKLCVTLLDPGFINSCMWVLHTNVFEQLRPQAKTLRCRSLSFLYLKHIFDDFTDSNNNLLVKKQSCNCHSMHGSGHTESGRHCTKELPCELMKVFKIKLAQLGCGSITQPAGPNGELVSTRLWNKIKLISPCHLLTREQHHSTPGGCVSRKHCF